MPTAWLKIVLCAIPWPGQVCHLVAALNPTDLDSLDESVPFTKRTLDNLLGRTLSPEEFGQYFGLFMNNPKSTPQDAQEKQRLWHPLYNEFARTDIEACQVAHVRILTRLHAYKVTRSSSQAYKFTCSQVYMLTSLHAYMFTCLHVYMFTC